jgi:sortase A
MVAVVAVAGIALLAVDLDNSPETIASFNSDSATTTTTTTTTAPTTTSSTTTTTTTTTTTSTTSTTSTTTTTELPKQSTEPIAPPSDPRGAENLGQLGSMSIPKIGVDAPLLEGIRLTTLDQGPGHWPGTAMPGEVGNVVVAGHRTSHEADFRHLDQLVPGDDVVFSTGAGVITYKVTGTHIVQPDAIWIVDPTDTPTATLFACHPLGSTAQRIVVNLALAS